MRDIFKAAALWFSSSQPELAEEDRILSPQEINHIRLMTKHSEHDDETICDLKQYFQEAVVRTGSQQYSQIHQKMVRQLELNQRIPVEFVEKFSAMPVTKLFKPLP